MGHEFVRWFAQQQVGPDPRELLADALDKARELVAQHKHDWAEAARARATRP